MWDGGCTSNGLRVRLRAMRIDSVNIGKFTHWFRQLSLWLVVSLVIMGLDHLGGLNWFKGPLEKVLWQGTRGAGWVVKLVEKPYQLVRYWNSGLLRTADLEARLTDAMVDKKKLIELEIENEQLKGLIGIEMTSDQDQKKWLASWLPDEGGGLVDKGKVDGIGEGMMVVDGQGALVGRIDEVGRYMSRVAKPTKIGERISVRLMSYTTEGIVVGDGVNVGISEVLQEDRLEIGDVLVTTGQDGVYKPGIIVGQVVELLGQKSDVVKSGGVELMAGDGRWVEILE